MLTTTQPSKTVDWAVDSSVNKSASFREHGKIFALLRERISPFFDNYGGSFLVSWLNNSGTPPPPPIPNLSRYIKLGKQFPIFLQLCFFTFTGSLWRCEISRQNSGHLLFFIGASIFFSFCISLPFMKTCACSLPKVPTSFTVLMTCSPMTFFMSIGSLHHHLHQ